MNMNFKYYDQENIEHDGELIAAVTINGKRYILYETEEIIFVQGFEHDGNTYYKLSDLKNLKIE